MVRKSFSSQRLPKEKRNGVNCKLVGEIMLMVPIIRYPRGSHGKVGTKCSHFLHVENELLDQRRWAEGAAVEMLKCLSVKTWIFELWRSWVFFFFFLI